MATSMKACPVERECGGCTQVTIPYTEQLTAKDERVRELFVEFAGVDIRSIIGMDEPYHYRNKVTSPFAPGKRGAGGKRKGASDIRGFGKGRDARRKRGSNGGFQGNASREILTGMYAAGTHRLVPTDGCLVESKQGQQVIQAIRSIMKRHGIAPYDEDHGSGFMRHAVVRVGHESGEVLVTLVTNSDEFPSSKSFCRELVKRCPFVTAVVQNVNTRKTNVILGEKERRLFGPGFILDTLCGLSFRVSSQSFYQVNAVQTTVLYEQAMQLAGFENNSTNCVYKVENMPNASVVIDAYCGTGTIGLVAAKRGAAQVIGVDSVGSAIRDACENARHNGVENARFVTADASAFMRERAATGERTDVVFMDPPRAGSTSEFLDALAQLAPERVVYISCNPETQVRDVRHLVGAGYVLRTVQPVDMFPHTDHIETVALLTHASFR